MENKFTSTIPDFSFYSHYIEYLKWKYPKLDSDLNRIAEGVEIRKLMQGDGARVSDYIKAFINLGRPVKIGREVLTERTTKLVKDILDREVAPFLNKNPENDVWIKNATVMEFVCELYLHWGLEVETHSDAFQHLLVKIER